MSAMDFNSRGGTAGPGEATASLTRNATAMSATDTRSFVHLNTNAVIQFSQEQEKSLRISAPSPRRDAATEMQSVLLRRRRPSRADYPPSIETGRPGTQCQ